MSRTDNKYYIDPKIAGKGITRNPKIDLIEFPEEIPNKKIVIFCNPSGYGFIKKNDNQKFLDESVSGADLNKTIAKMNKIIDIQLGNKKNSEAKDSNANNIFILNILFVLGLVISLVMYILALYEVEDFKEKYIVIPLILMLLIIILGMIVMMMGLMKTRE